MALTDYIIMPGADYQAACDKIREKSGKTDLIKSGDLASEIEGIAGSGVGSVDGVYVEYTVDSDGSVTSVAPVGFTVLPSYIFMSFAKLTEVDFSRCSNLAKIDDFAFSSCDKLEEINVPDTVTEIGIGAFGSCTSLTTVALPNSIVTINMGTFRGCSKLRECNMPTELVYINQNAFSNCKALTEITLPSNVFKIHSEAFASCSNLQTVTFTNHSDTVYENMFIQENVFDGCSNLAVINVPWSEGRVSGAPWGATNATINYNYTGE